jgi:ribulose-phosphate 3-epimerase
MSASGTPRAGGPLLAASILDSNLADLGREIRRAVRAGADRIHLDVMDGHFVPNLTFGAVVVKRLRPVTPVPLDAHLMISEPSRYVDGFIEAGCESITIHVEVDEPVEPTLCRIQAAGRLAGLSVRPHTPLSSLEPYRDLLDLILIMTVEPGFGGQSFMSDAAAKIRPARDYLADPSVGEIQVDGGINADTAAECGALGVDVLVVGSTLWKPGHDLADQIATIKARAAEGRGGHAGRVG